MCAVFKVTGRPPETTRGSGMAQSGPARNHPALISEPSLPLRGLPAAGRRGEDMPWERSPREASTPASPLRSLLPRCPHEACTVSFPLEPPDARMTSPPSWQMRNSPPVKQTKVVILLSLCPGLSLPHASVPSHIPLVSLHIQGGKAFLAW